MAFEYEATKMEIKEFEVILQTLNRENKHYYGGSSCPTREDDCFI